MIWYRVVYWTSFAWLGIANICFYIWGSWHYWAQLAVGLLCVFVGCFWINYERRRMR